MPWKDYLSKNSKLPVKGIFEFAQRGTIEAREIMATKRDVWYYKNLLTLRLYYLTDLSRDKIANIMRFEPRMVNDIVLGWAFISNSFWEEQK